jgi:hypothetical protein
MKDTHQGGPAFPQETNSLLSYSGMTLRDYFAAQAMTGAQIWDAVLNKKNAYFSQVNGCNALAETAYAIADAMLKEREK